MSKLKKKEKKKSDPVVTLLDIVIVVMIFAMIPVGYNFFFYLSRANTFSSFTQDASRMSFDLTRNDYASLIQGRYMNEFNGINDAVSYHALAEYTEAVSEYKVYVEKGYTDKADRQKKIMDNSRKKMGNLEIFADKVDVMFDIE
ncbi:MAG: hypothetical protein IK123_00860 [Lachnospiraceae bacterium]|nr:hypothetical protein [Lachnospiraceae bacterium]